MKNKPLISVLMTVYNRDKYIAEAIESVIDSTYQNWELIITDNCSTDKSYEIAEKFEKKDSRIKVFKNEKNLGQFPNRNRAVTHAKGKYIKYLDSDDTIYPFGLKTMVDAMEQFPEAGIGLPYTQWVTSKHYPFLVQSNIALIDHFFKSNFLAFGPSATIYRRDFFNKIGGFENKYKVVADFAFTLKAVCESPVVCFQRDLIWWRNHEEQEFSTKSSEFIEVYFPALKNNILSEQCPLNESEKQIIIRNSKNINARKVIKLMMKFKFKISKKIIKYFELSFSDFIKAFRRNRKLPTTKI